MNVHDVKDFINNNKHLSQDKKDKQFIKDDQTPPQQYHLESSWGEVKDFVTAYNLQTYFGGRKWKDFSLLSKLGTEISVINNVKEIPTVGELVNRKQGKRCQKGTRATAPLEMVGMNIGYGDGVYIGGSKYILVLVDQYTTKTCVYGMQGWSGGDVCKAFWKFLIDAGVFPKIFQCDFDPRLIRDRAAALLLRHVLICIACFKRHPFSVKPVLWRCKFVVSMYSLWFEAPLFMCWFYCCDRIFYSIVLTIQNHSRVRGTKMS